MQAWDANPEFDFEFDSRGPDVAIDSDEASKIKAALPVILLCTRHRHRGDS
jgi:hypothetical protein